MKIRWTLLILGLFCLPAQAGVEAAGVDFEPSAKVGADETALNGVAVRRVLWLKAYAIGLYLPQRTAVSFDAITMSGPKRLRLVCLRDITAEQFINALSEGLRRNLGEQRIAPLVVRLEYFKQTLLSLRIAREGADIALDWLPQVNGGVTRLSIDGKIKGDDIPGEDFFQALLKIWLGDEPPARDMKDGLLGKTQ